MESTIFICIFVMLIRMYVNCDPDIDTLGYLLKPIYLKASHKSAVRHCKQNFSGKLFEILSVNDVAFLKRTLNGSTLDRHPFHVKVDESVTLSSHYLKSPKNNEPSNGNRTCFAIFTASQDTDLLPIKCNTKLNFICQLQTKKPQKHLEKRAASYSFLFVNKNLLKIMTPSSPFDANACKSFVKDNYENNLASRVVGGQIALYGSQPWQVEIAKIKHGGRIEHHCSGAIVSEFFVLSTAHCFSKSHDRYLQTLRVITGDHNIEVRDKHEAEYQIDKVAIHPKHLASMYMNDIAVIKLKAKMGRGIVFGSHVRPVCMPNYDTLHLPGTECQVSGWGLTEDSLLANVSTVLRSARVNLVSAAQCSDMYRNYNPVNEGMLCAGHLRGGIDSCRGDSGGPLVCNTTSGTTRLFGLVSWGESCALKNRPGVYVKIQHYLKWIAEKIDEMS